MRHPLAVRSALLVFVVSLHTAVVAGPVARASFHGSSIEWHLAVEGHRSVVLTVSAPDGQVYRQEFAAGEAVSLRLKDLTTVKDGRYTYQLLVSPRIPADVQRQLDAARDAAGIRTPLVQDGGFVVRHGAIVSPAALERTPAPSDLRPTVNDQLVADDLIVDGRACVGFSCVVDETFSEESLLLKGINVRLKFLDTSGQGNPGNDWQLTANDLSGGSLERFSIEDLTTGSTPFTIAAGAQNNTLYVSALGRIGVGTSTPAGDLQISRFFENPSIVLEHSGFPPWGHKIASRFEGLDFEDLFTGMIPFRIHSEASTNTLAVGSGGRVGIGTNEPARPLHIIHAGAAENTVLEVENDGPTRMRIRNGKTGEAWNIGHQSPSGTGLVYSDAGDSTSEMLLSVSGNLTIAGTLTQGSSREIKKDFQSLDPALALEGLRNLPILTWSYKDEGGVRHIGPMAEEFHSTFGFGNDDKHIAPSDQAGVALAAIQALAKEKDGQIERLEWRIKQLEMVIDELRRQVQR